MKRKLWGIILVIIGVVIGLNALDITNINLFFDGWWTLFIIIPCFIDLFNEKEKTGNIIGIVIGFLLLLSCQGIIDFEIIFKLAIPIILILIGLSFIFKDNLKKVKFPKKDNELDYASTFSFQTLTFDDEKFEGCDMNAIFGGIKCDLRNALIKDETIIKASAIFGGINLIVPENIKIVVKSTSIFGGVSNKHINSKDSKKVIYLDATCLFGGIEIDDTDTKDN